MLILTIRTDKPDAEIGLYDSPAQLAYVTWQAHRQLAETLHAQIKNLLTGQARTLSDVEGIVCYQGPGSFTGLRIGLTVANALAYALEIPVVAQMDTDEISDNKVQSDTWLKSGIDRLLAGDAEPLAIPEYGAEANITRPVTRPAIQGAHSNAPKV